MSEFEDKLKQMDENWKEGKDTPPGPPDGVYTLQLQGCSLREAQTSGNLYILREHLVVDGEYEGEVVRDMMSLETDRGPYFVARWIDQMGYQPPESAQEIPDILEALENDAPIYIGQVRHNGDFINVRVQEVLEQTAQKEEKSKPTQKKAPTKKASVKKEEPEAEEEIAIDSFVTFTDTEAGEITGKVINMEDEDEIHVEDAEGTVWGCPLAELSLINMDDSDGDEGIEVAGLLALAQACGIEDVSDEDTIETLTKKLSQYEWPEEELVEDEIGLLHSVGITTKKSTPKKAAPKKAAPKRKK